MRKELLIFGLIVLILGIAINNIIGNVLLIVGILILLYVIFSKENPKKSSKSLNYIENRDYNKNTNKTPDNLSKNKIKNETSDKKTLNKCPECGSTKNPQNARFCADCGKKL